MDSFPQSTCPFKHVIYNSEYSYPKDGYPPTP